MKKSTINRLIRDADLSGVCVGSCFELLPPLNLATRKRMEAHRQLLRTNPEHPHVAVLEADLRVRLGGRYSYCEWVAPTLEQEEAWQAWERLSKAERIETLLDRREARKVQNDHITA